MDLTEVADRLEQLKWAVNCGAETDLRTAADEGAEALEELLQVVRSVRELHVEDVFRGHLSNGCVICGGGVGWPCPTVQTLEGVPDGPL